MSPNLLLLIFGVELFIHVVNSVGAATINNLIWGLLNRFPTETSKLVAENRKLQKEYLKLRRELNATSSQDQFAKWAKLRRQHHKLLEQLEKKKAEMNASKSKFDSSISVARLLLTKAPHFILPMWYAKEPMFWLPQGLFPHYAEWFLSLPKAPLGSVSILSWQVACTVIIKLVSDALVGLYALVATAKPQREGVPVPGRTATPSASKTEKTSEKKEL
ncbi:hypothetical protein jhhlp_005543 [Lomentospora prolificans]|uniref:Uncharacterized protein n=1 Tax=Lomentospora prolificans TaxID=41688 RepID=A0A2N3N3E7_9PEZI|nr:hypothetical protein jhhlp_005543 [Lomentospora prolificans]